MRQYVLRGTEEKRMKSTQSEYKQPYLLLFRGVTEALEQLQQQNYGLAAALLKQAQQAAEEAYIAQDEQE